MELMVHLSKWEVVRPPRSKGVEISIRCTLKWVSVASYLQQELPQGNKSGSIPWFLSPTLQHDVIDVLGTVLRLWKPFAFFIDLVENLIF